MEKIRDIVKKISSTLLDEPEVSLQNGRTLRYI
jgi:hypothetical protein